MTLEIPKPLAHPELEQEVDDMIDFYDHLAFEAMHKIVTIIRGEGDASKDKPRRERSCNPHMSVLPEEIQG